MKNAAFPDQIGGCEKSMHYPDDPLFSVCRQTYLLEIPVR